MALVIFDKDGTLIAGLGKRPANDTQPALFPDLPGLARRDAEPNTVYRGGQSAMLCCRCFATVGPFMRSKDGHAYCISCARLVAQKG